MARMTKAAAALATNDARSADATTGNAEIPLNMLLQWPGNPRRTRSAAGLDSTAASLRVHGQLMPMLVLAIGGGFHHVIDGERRRQSMEINVETGHTQADQPVRVFVLDPKTSQADLIAIATIVNVEREQMNPIEEMEAYSAMKDAGMKPREIAEQFSVGVRQILQRISLGDLVEGARDLVRTGARQIRWAEAMTLGSPKQQERVVAEIQANPQAFVDGGSVRMDLTRGNIPVSSALFDPSELSDCIVADLFRTAEESTFSDAERFWTRQNEAIEALHAEHGATHGRVDEFRGRRFHDAGWMTGGDPATSTAVIVVRDDGSVKVMTGMVAPAGYYEDRTGDSGDIFGDAHAMFGADLDPASAPAAVVAANDGATPIRRVDPLEVPTKATEAYIEAQVVAQLRLRAANEPRVAMAFVIAQTLTRTGRLASSMEISGLNLETDRQTSAVFQRLQARRQAHDRTMRDSGLLGVRSPAAAVELLLALDDQALGQVFAWTVSQSVSPGFSDVAFDAVSVLGMAPMDGWEIDETYISTLSQSQKRALCDRVVPVAAQPARNAPVPTVVRAIVAAVESSALAGDWTTTGGSWLPPQVERMRDAAEARADAQARAAQDAVAAATGVAA